MTTMSPGWIPLRRLLPWLPLPPYLVQREDAVRLRAELRAAGFDIADVDASEVASESDLLRGLGAALAFPDYYGGNWDAFHDCIGDLTGEAEAPLAVVVHAVDRLAREDPHAFVRSVHLLELEVEAVARDQDGRRLEVLYVGAWTSPPGQP